MADGLQIGKSNENTSVFIDFPRIQGGPAGTPRIELIRKCDGNIPIQGAYTVYSIQFATSRISHTAYRIEE